MVDFKISTPQDNVEVKYSIDSSVVHRNANQVNASTDSIVQLAQTTGLVDAMHQVNAESAEADQFITQEENEEDSQEVLEADQEEEERPRRKEKVKRDKERDARVNDLIYQANEAARERDAYALRLQQMEMELLKQKNVELDRDVTHVASVLRTAQISEDEDAYVDAQKLLSQLTHEQFKTHESLEQAQEAYEARYQSYQKPEPIEERDDMRSQLLLEFSHKKELRSEYYQDWLDENEVFNPYSEDYNPHLANEFKAVKDEFNNYLYAHGQQSQIGTEEYYQELDDLRSMHNQRKYGTAPFSEDPYEAEEEATAVYEQPYYGENQMSQPISRASVAPINRQGYQNPYGGGGHASLPELTKDEMMVAEMCPMTDAPVVRGVMPRYLTNEEKYEVYKRNKAKMMGMPT